MSEVRSERQAQEGNSPTERRFGGEKSKVRSERQAQEGNSPAKAGSEVRSE